MAITVKKGENLGDEKGVSLEGEHHFEGNTCSYGSRASQFLELGVSEFWQLFPSHMLSLESVLRFCHGIAKGGDCKVEFIQSFFGSIPCQICL